jgi:hypothetical protein
MSTHSLQLQDPLWLECAAVWYRTPLECDARGEIWNRSVMGSSGRLSGELKAVNLRESLANERGQSPNHLITIVPRPKFSQLSENVGIQSANSDYGEGPLEIRDIEVSGGVIFVRRKRVPQIFSKINAPS